VSGLRLAAGCSKKRALILAEIRQFRQRLQAPGLIPEVHAKKRDEAADESHQ